VLLLFVAGDACVLFQKLLDRGKRLGE